MNLQEKIITIQNELRVTKDGLNRFANYNYFQPDTILNLLNPLLQKHGVFTKFNLHYKETYYTAELLLVNVEKPTETELYVFDILKATVKGANEAQNSGATLTYAKRYSLMNAFNIAENNADFDSDAMKSKEIKAVKSDRDYSSEAKKFLDLKEVKEWWGTLTPDEQKEARQIKEATQRRIIEDNVEDFIGKLKSNTWEGWQLTVEEIIQEEKDKDRQQYLINLLTERLNKVGITDYEFSKLPF